jgi:hypothetical protein
MQLKAAIQAHTNQVNRCANGHDVDRHLYALYCLWSKYHAKSHTRHVGADKLKKAKTISDLNSESDVTGNSVADRGHSMAVQTESRSSTESKSSAGFLSLFGGGKDKSKPSQPTTAPKRSAQEFLAGMDLEQPELAERACTKMDVDMGTADDETAGG